MPALGLENLLPYLAQQQQQNVAEQRRQERESRIVSDYLTVFQDGSREEKIAAAGRLGASGVGVPSSVFQDPANAEALLDLVKAPEEVKQAYRTGAITIDQAMNIGSKTGDPFAMDLEFYQNLFKLDPRLSETGETPERMVARSQLAKRIGVEATNRIYGVEGGGGKPSALTEKRQAVREIIGDRNPVDILQDQKALAELEVLGVSKRDLLGIYGIDPPAIVDAQRSIREELAAIDPQTQFDFGAVLAKWVAGDTEDMAKETLRLLDKYFDKQKGTMKPEAVIDRADEIMDIALQRALGDTQARNAPREYRTILVDMAQSGLTKAQLIEAYKIEKADPNRVMEITDEEFEELLQYLPEK